MHRSAAFVFAALVGLAAALVVMIGRPPPLPEPAPSASAETSAQPVVIVAPSGASFDAAPSLDSSGLEPWRPLAPEGSASPNATAGQLLDGKPVPPLAVGSPKTVRFGVILVAYRGAEQAPRDAREKEAALELARAVADQAKKDFAAAIPKGDWGAADAGTLQQGVLEPGPEHVLFGLAPGEVGGPVDSPRGYCVFKRVE